MWRHRRRLPTSSPNIGGYAAWWDMDRSAVEVVEATPPSRFVTRIADPDQLFGGSWTVQIARDGVGSRVTVTEHRGV
jgi:hypothetical protein